MDGRLLKAGLSVLKWVATATMLQELVLVLLWNISPFRRVFKGVSPVIFVPAFPYQLSGLLKSLNPSGVFWGFVPLLLNAYFQRKQCIAEISLSSWPFLFYLVAKSVNSSATFTHAIVSIAGSQQAPAPAGKDSFWPLLVFGCLAPQSCCLALWLT